MSREEVLKSIKNAEKKATEALEEAEKRAGEIISRARLSATEIIQDGKMESDSDAEKIVSKAKDKAGSEAIMIILDSFSNE